MGSVRQRKMFFVSTGERSRKSASCNNGAFIRSLKQELGEMHMHMHREAYYGGTFTGNSAHGCLKVVEQIIHIRHNNTYHSHYTRL